MSYFLRSQYLRLKRMTPSLVHRLMGSRRDLFTWRILGGKARKLFAYANSVQPAIKDQSFLKSNRRGLCALTSASIFCFSFCLSYYYGHWVHREDPVFHRDKFYKNASLRSEISDPCDHSFHLLLPYCYGLSQLSNSHHPETSGPGTSPRSLITILNSACASASASTSASAGSRRDNWT